MKVVVFLLASLLSLAAACGPSDETATPPPAPTPPPSEVLNEAAEALLGLETLAFTLGHESGNIPLMPGVIANELSGIVAMPDELRVQIKGEVEVFRAYLELTVVRTEGIYYLTDPLTGDWRIVDESAVPFNLTSVGITLGNIMKVMTNTAYAGDGYEGDTIRITGKVLSQQLDGLIPFAGEGYEVDLEVWIRKADSLPEKARIQGQVVDSDAASYVRILTLYGFNEPVTIEKPPI